MAGAPEAAWEPPAAPAGAPPGAAAGPAAWRRLAEAGEWRALVEAAQGGIGVLGTAAALGAEAKEACAFYFLALFKLRLFAQMAEELQHVGDVATADFPFLLRLLHAELPHHLDNDGESAARLYALLDDCRRRAEAGQAGPGAAAAWARRHDATLHALARHHLRRKEYVAALQLLNWVRVHRGPAPGLLAAVGYVLLQMGDVKHAEAVFREVEAAAAGRPPGDPAQALCGRSRGLVKFAGLDFDGAIAECARAAPGDGTASNNCTLAHLYACDLAGGVGAMEAALQRQPREHLREPLLLNLTSLYELASAHGPQQRRRLEAWARAFAPEDFGHAWLS